ncbi:MAG TPA: glycosyltransferase family 4 protein [Gaiellaceae bacterium]|nr:glycosyltransferase family 4 protein [Gaiellaceae bacterium]
MRIVFVAPRAWPAFGGMEAFLHHLAGGLAARGHDVRVLAQGLDGGPRSRLADSLRPPPSFQPFRDGAVAVEPIRLSPARRAALAPLVAQVVPVLRRHAYGRPRLAANRLYARVAAPPLAAQAAGAAVVHAWGGDLLAAATLRAGRLLGAPAAITPFAHAGQWGDVESFAATYRRADRVLGLLQADAGLYERLGVPRERIEVCGVCSPGVEPGGGAALRARHGIDGPLVLFLGVRRPYKGCDLLLEAARSLPGATVAFVGPGDPVEPPAGVRAVDAGEVDEAERAAWLDAADLLCLPSAAEILPVSILEAWSARTPVVTSDIPPLRELVDRSGGGVACTRDAATLADTLRRLLADPARLRALGEAGHAFWRRELSVEAVAARHEALYAELAGEEAACAA